jgi:hypothetical protein
MATAVVYGDGTDFLEPPAFTAGSVTLVTAPTGYTVPDYIEQDGLLVVVDSLARRRSLSEYAAFPADWPHGWTYGVPYTVTATYTAALPSGTASTASADESDVLEQLGRLVASTDDPELDDDELLQCLGTSQSGTVYNLNAAAAAAWRMKAAKVAHRYTYQDPSGEYTRSDLFKHCLQMAAQFDGLAAGTSTVTTVSTGIGVW